jgi:hypothetical protein
VATTAKEDAVNMEERDLIVDLFERMRSFGVPVKDREAEALIHQSVRVLPDAPYMLVQSALVQEQALEQAGARISELEDQLRELEGRKQASDAGNFLGGLFGKGRQPASPSSVPHAGTRHGEQPQDAPSQAPAPATGGFLHSAMTTAAGVAGGMLVSNAIRNMLGGHAVAGPMSSEVAQRERERLARQDAEDDVAADQRDLDAQEDAEADAQDDNHSGDETEI